MEKSKPSKKLRNIFVKEAEDHISVICSLLEEDRRIDDKLLAGVKAALHNLKGAASMMGYTYLSDVAAHFETFLKDAEPEKIIKPDRIDFSAAAITALTRMLANIKQEEEEKNKELYEDFNSAWQIAQAIYSRLSEKEPPEPERGDIKEEERELRKIFIEGAREKIGNIGYTIYSLAVKPDDGEALERLKSQWNELIIEAKTLNETELALILELGNEFIKPENLKDGAKICAEALESVINNFDKALASLEGEKSQANAVLLETAPLMEEFRKRLRDAREKKREKKTAKTEPKVEKIEEKKEAPSKELDPQLLEFFLPEAREYLDELNRLLLKWEANLDDRDILYTLFRLTHSLKGAAATVGFSSLSKIAHSMEDRFSAIREGAEKPTRQVLQSLFEQADRLTATIMQAARLGGENEEKKSAKEPRVEREREPLTTEELGRLAAKTIRVMSDDVDRLFDITAELIQTHSRLEEMRNWLAELEQDFLRDRQTIRKLIERIVARYEYSLQKAEPQIAALPSGEREESLETSAYSFGEAEFDKYDDINILARRLDEMGFAATGTSSRIEYLLNELDSQIESLGTLIDIAKERILNLRMIPLDTTFRRLARPLRDALKDEGKEARLKVEGGENRVDKMFTEALVDPLIQLIRNSVAHGIEPAEERERLGKERTGNVMVKAVTEGRRITITVSDDGRGIDPKEIRRILVEKRMMDESIAESVSDEKIIDAIFFPAISTKAKSDILAGRGVGLDLVRQTVTRLGGSVTVSSTLGRGTEFTISLPLTTAIMLVLMVEVGDYQLALPLDSVISTGHLRLNEIYEKEGQALYKFNGQDIPVLDIGGVWSPERKSGLSSISPYIALAAGERKIAFLVNELLRIDEVVLRPLSDFFAPLKYFSGAAIGGDGKLRLVVNPGAIYGLVSSKSASFADIMQRSRIKRVMLVDDSLSIRQVVGGFIQAGGFRVDTAVDGQDAWEKLHQHRYDLVMTDLEMPRMHGYELIERILSHPILKEIPIVVISSRSGKKHIEKATEMGARAYIAKPAAKKQVLAILEQFLGAPIVT
ncbi:MAG: hypothetical protein Kow0090_16700 [Myxococcota bacterium]